MSFRAFWVSSIIVLYSFLAFAQDGEDLTRADRAAVIYGARLTFTKKHIPIVTVGIIDGYKTVRFSSNHGFDFYPDGLGGPVISTKDTNIMCQAKILRSRPAQIKYYVVLQEFALNQMDRINKALRDLDSKGIKYKTFQVGTVFGFYGHVMDNRRFLIVRKQGYDRLSDAVRMQKKLRPDLMVHEVLQRPPQGIIRITCDKLNAVISAPEYLFFRPKKGVTTVYDVEFGKGFSWHGRQTRSYRGMMYFAVSKNGALAMVNSINATDLLAGLVPSEIPTSSPMETLKAQAVAARTELLAKLGTRHFADPYMLCADVHCQVYRGVGRENSKTTKAVRQTRGLLLFDGNKLMDAVYSSNCGGVSESAHAIWGQGSDRNGGLLDKKVRQKVSFQNEARLRDFLLHPPGGLFCSKGAFAKRTFRWRVSRDLDELGRLVYKYTHVRIGSVKDIKILKRGISGRVLKLEVIGTLNSLIIKGELNIRKAFGGLKSALFVIDKKDKNWEFIGGGFGHGVGMCQVGAIQMGKEHFDFKEILKHYYPDSQVVRIY